jgi:hypothetical protein
MAALENAKPAMSLGEPIVYADGELDTMREVKAELINRGVDEQR